MKITRRQLRQIIKEELEKSRIEEAQPGPAKGVPQSARTDIFRWMSSSRLSITTSKYKMIKGQQKLTFVLSEDGKASIDVSTEWENTKENQERRRKAGAAPITDGHTQSLERAIQRAMRGQSPGTYTMSYSL
tara:strand:- start:4316 stop:4711 length:396 start_codon:yes stop_codon:yes gene_type:complete